MYNNTNNNKQLPPNPHPSMLSSEDLLKGCEIRYGKTGGPGGQHRNKNETAVWLTHKETGIESSASERRERQVNLKVATKRLRINLAINHRVPSPKKPTQTFSGRCVRQKLELNPKHEDFPAMLAEAMDRLHENNGDMAKTARQFELTTSQLIKLIKFEPKAWEKAKPDSSRQQPRRLYRF